MKCFFKASQVENSSSKIDLSDFCQIKEQIRDGDHLDGYQEVPYAFAKEFVANKDENNYVPMILHFLWVGKPIPERYLDAVIGFEETNTDFEVTVDSRS